MYLYLCICICVFVFVYLCICIYVFMYLSICIRVLQEAEAVCVDGRGNRIANALNAKCVVKHSINHVIGHMRRAPTPHTKHQGKFEI